MLAPPTRNLKRSGIGTGNKTGLVNIIYRIVAQTQKDVTKASAKPARIQRPKNNLEMEKLTFESETAFISYVALILQIGFSPAKTIRHKSTSENTN